MNANEQSMTGTVKMWNDQLGYGFIEDPSGGRDIYVHAKQINIKQAGRKSLKAGALVAFEVEEKAKGPSAVNVRTL
jgi:CspA family cold shock protein